MNPDLKRLVILLFSIATTVWLRLSLFCIEAFERKVFRVFTVEISCGADIQEKSEPICMPGVIVNCQAKIGKNHTCAHAGGQNRQHATQYC